MRIVELVDMDLLKAFTGDMPTAPTAPTSPSGVNSKVGDQGSSISPATKSKQLPSGGKGSVGPSVIQSYLSSKGLDKNHVAGIMANIKHESGFRPGVMGDGGTSGGLFQHHAGRFTAMVSACGGKDKWQSNWQGQIDFALSEPAGRQYTGMKFSSPEEATKWWTINFEIPANKVAQANIRSQSASQFA